MSNLVVTFATLFVLLLSFNVGHALRCQQEGLPEPEQLLSSGLTANELLMPMASFAEDGDADEEECLADATYCVRIKCGDFRLKGCANPADTKAGCDAVKRTCNTHSNGALHAECHYCQEDNCNSDE